MKKCVWPQNLSEVGTAQRHCSKFYNEMPESNKIDLGTVEFETLALFGTGGSNVKPSRSIWSLADPNFTFTMLLI